MRPHPRSEADAQPASMDGVVAELATRGTRDEVVRLACQGAVTVARSAIFLARRKSVVLGWESAGSGVSRDAVRNLWLPLSSPSVFRDAVLQNETYLGPHGIESVDVVFRAVVASQGGRLMVRPIALRGQVVALLCTDGLGWAQAGCDRVQVLGDEVGRAFERILIAGKNP